VETVVARVSISRRGWRLGIPATQTLRSPVGWQGCSRSARSCKIYRATVGFLQLLMALLSAVDVFLPINWVKNWKYTCSSSRGPPTRRRGQNGRNSRSQGRDPAYFNHCQQRWNYADSRHEGCMQCKWLEFVLDTLSYFETGKEYTNTVLVTLKLCFCLSTCSITQYSQYRTHGATKSLFAAVTHNSI